MECLGFVEKLEKKAWMDQDGNVFEDNYSFGCHYNHNVMHLGILVVFNDTVGEISQNREKHIIGEVILFGCVTIPQKKIL